jgi:hypothetical protein
MTFIFYINSDGNIGYLTGPAVTVTDTTHYNATHQVLIGGAPVHVVDGFEHLGAIAYNNKQASPQSQ